MHFRSVRLLYFCLLATCGMPPAIAQSAPNTKPPACTAAEYRQFDFWQGDWDVRDASGKNVGRNRIVAVQGGCALQENWTGAGGVSGTSLNLYDNDRKRWHQRGSITAAGSCSATAASSTGRWCSAANRSRRTIVQAHAAANHVDAAIRRPRSSAMGIVDRFRRDVVSRIRRNLFEAAVTAMGHASAVPLPRD